MKKMLLALLLLFLPFNMFAPVVPGFDSRNMIEEYLIKQEQIRKQLEFDKFLNHLGYKESRNNWKAYNKYGYIGEFQFGKSALKATGYQHITFWNFKRNPQIFPPIDQRLAVEKLIELNIKRLGLTDSIIIKDSTYINNILITKAGLVAAAHLGGARGVQLFLNSQGKINKRDAYGTSIADYLQEFSNFEI